MYAYVQPALHKASAFKYLFVIVCSIHALSKQLYGGYIAVL